MQAFTAVLLYSQMALGMGKDLFDGSVHTNAMYYLAPAKTSACLQIRTTGQ